MAVDPNVQQDDLPGVPPGGNGAAQEDPEDGQPDPAAMQAELERYKRLYGESLNKQKKYAKAEAERAKLREMLDAINEVTVEHNLTSPEDLRKVLNERAEAETEKAKKGGDVDKLLENAEQRHRKDLAKRDQVERQKDGEIAQLRATIDVLTIDRQVNDVLATMVEPQLIKGVFAMLRSRFKAVYDEDEPNGIPAVVAEVDGDQLPAKDFLKQWAENDPDAQAYLIGNRSTGGGAPAAGAARGAAPKMRRSKMSAKERGEYMLKYGVDRYKQLPA